MSRVQAALQYLAPMAETPRTYSFDPPGGGPRFNGRLASHQMAIEDGRPLRATLSLDMQGFVLVNHESRVRDFWDEDELSATYHAEAERLVRALTGAVRAKVFDHTLRRRAPGRPALDGTGGSFAGVRQPVGRAHADYTARSAPLRLRQVMGEEADALLARRYAILGLWRPTNREPLLDAPLAVADARSVSPADLVVNELIYPDRVGETYAAMHNPAHRWFYFPHQRRDEVIVFKNYDSGTQAGLAHVAPHTAFEHPDTPADAPPRESIELRAFAFFAE